MNVLIVENEKPAAGILVRLLHHIDPAIQVSGIVETVEGTINWIQDHDRPDLILMDIQLDDGLCFEVFETIRLDIPVIFTTAYDEYTLRAFKVNSIDYLLKPVEVQALRAALRKYRGMYASGMVARPDFDRLLGGYSSPYKSRFLVKIGSRYRSIPVMDVAFIHIAEKNVFLRTMEGKDFAVDYSLDRLQSMLDPAVFFRINRACIVPVHSVAEMHSLSAGRFQLVLRGEPKSALANDLFMVSRDKISEFKQWVDR